jgi:hypothetical protein
VGVLAAVTTTGCTGDDSKTTSAEGRRVLWPEHIVERPNGELWIVGIAQARGVGFTCGGEGPEIAEFTVVRLAPNGEIRGVSSVPQEELESCAEEATYLTMAGGAVVIDGLIRLESRSEGDADAGMMRAVFEPSGQARSELSDKVPPDLDGIAVSRDGTGYLSRVRWPRRPARALTDAMRAFEFKAFMGIAAQPDGKTIGAGQLDSGSRRKAFAVRVDRTGRPDRSFGKSGIVLLEIGRRTDDLYADARAAMILQRDGKIVIAASIRGRQTRVFRLRPDGTTDPGFGRRGTFLMPRV